MSLVQASPSSCYRAGLRKCRYVLKMTSPEVPPADLAMPQLPTDQSGLRNTLQKLYQNIATLTQPLSVELWNLCNFVGLVDLCGVLYYRYSLRSVRTPPPSKDAIPIMPFEFAPPPSAIERAIWASQIVNAGRDAARWRRDGWVDGSGGLERSW